MVIDENVVLGILIYLGVIGATFWLALIIWAYRDMRARSRDGLAQILVGVMVVVLNIPGVFIYLLLRPRETLSEAYERSLEEEALLQEIEEKPSCPGCSQRVHENWQACPHCHTRLKKGCINCQHMLELSWNLCPHCATPQHIPTEHVVTASRHVQQQPIAVSEPPEIPQQWLSNNDVVQTAPRSDIEFLDEDY